MNNKYDVKNFSDMIDKFDLQEELKTVCTEIDNQITEQRQNHAQSLFDPVMDTDNRQKAEYIYAQYTPQRYDMPGLMNSVKFFNSYSEQQNNRLSEQSVKKEDSKTEIDPKHQKLLAGPPRTLLSHPDKEEVLNYLLDKAFSQW